MSLRLILVGIKTEIEVYGITGVYIIITIKA